MRSREVYLDFLSYPGVLDLVFNHDMCVLGTRVEWMFADKYHLAYTTWYPGKRVKLCREAILFTNFLKNVVLIAYNFGNRKSRLPVPVLGYLGTERPVQMRHQIPYDV